MTEEPAVAPGRIVLLTASHRVAPGLLSWPAWQTLREADQVLCGDPGHPQLPYLREAGVTVALAAPTAQELVDACAGGRTVVVLPSGEGDQTLTDGLSRLAGSGRVQMPDLELLPGSYDLPGARLLDLVQVMDRIRAECPWSSTRTHEGLAKYAIEESYELVEAIESGDRGELREELGDVLLQVVFHARIAEEEDEPFSIDDVAATIVEKLIHRHPHVFGDEKAGTPEDVKEHWLRTKAAEKQRDSITSGVPWPNRPWPWRPNSPPEWPRPPGGPAPPDGGHRLRTPDPGVPLGSVRHRPGGRLAGGGPRVQGRDLGGGIGGTELRGVAASWVRPGLRARRSVPRR